MHAVGADHEVIGLATVIVEAHLDVVPGWLHVGDRRIPADPLRRHASPQQLEQITARLHITMPPGTRPSPSREPIILLTVDHPTAPARTWTGCPQP